MNNKTKLRIGIVGCGPIAQIEWLPYIHELDEYEMVSLCDISRMLVDYYGDLYGVRKRYVNWEDLVASNDVDAIIVLNKNHVEVCLAAAEAKKHVLVEKPMCENPRQAREIVRAVKESGITFMIGEMKRYDPGYLYAKKVIREMKGLRMIRARDFCDGLERSLDEIYKTRRRTDVPSSIKKEKDRKFREGMKEVSGNLSEDLYYFLLMAGVHDIDIMRAAFGEPQGVQYCDIWDDGNIVVAELDYGQRVKALVEIGYTKQKWFEEELIAYGLDKTVTVKFPHPYLKNCPTLVEIREIEDGAVVEKTVSASFEESFRNELKHFYHCVMENIEPLTNVEGGQKDIELLAAIFDTYARRIQDGK